MNKKTQKNKKLYIGIFVMSLIAIIIGSYMFQMHVFEKVLIFQQNMIGILYQQDELYAKECIYAMFESVSEENLGNGNIALQKFGYTQEGIRYIGKNMGLWQTYWSGMGWLFLGGCIVLIGAYKMLNVQRQEIRMLQQEILVLKQHQMKDEYIINQNKRIQSFIENIAHQIKTPLSRVFSSLDIVQDVIKEASSKQYIEECYQHLEGINVLIKRLMDIGRFEAGKIMFQKERFYLHEFLEDVKTSCAGDKARIHIHCEMEKMEYYGDVKWLKEAFSNIISNALEVDKTLHPIEISCLQSEDDIKISIRDHGPGLSEKDIPNVFDRFYLPESIKENHTGIGLNLAKLIIEGHQGFVYVYNHHEGGAVFQVVLPLYETLKIRKIGLS